MMAGAAAQQAAAGHASNPSGGRRCRRCRRLGQRLLVRAARSVQSRRQDQPGGGTASSPVIQHSLWRRPDRRRGQHQQSADHSRIQSQESLQPVAVHLRSDHGSRRPDHDAGAARVAGGGSAAAAELIESGNSSGSSSPLAGCRVRHRRPSLRRRSNNRNLEMHGYDGRDARPPFLRLLRVWFSASTMRSISITPIHWPLRVSV